MRVGLISDTHDLLRPEAKDFLGGSDHIVHCGDICAPQILQALRAIAPVTAVRGNNDRGPWTDHLPARELVALGGIFLYALHDLAQLDIEPRAAGVRVVASGHSHKPAADSRDGVLFVNPGSAGPRRFSLPISAGEIAIAGDRVSVRIVDLQSGSVLASSASARRVERP